uniref:Structural protein n=1 Tax=Electric ant polycipivirus 2 TaxID=3003606 RepID=A0AA95E5Y9_9VIRU|nr:structural protein [Electric ant polycipivirus 2]
MEPLEANQNTIQSRATEIDTGALPLPMENVLLGLPQKPEMAIERLSVSSTPWSFSDIVSQKKLFNTITVTPDTPTDLPLYIFKNSWDNVYKNHFRSFKDFFLLKSFTLNFLFEFRSNFQQVGMFNIVYSNIPQNLISYLVGYENFVSYSLQTQLPHRKVFMGEDSDVHIQLKWVSPFKSGLATERYYPDVDRSEGGYTTSDDYDMGSLYLYLPFGMNVSTGVDSTMTVRVWSYLTDVDYSGYTINDNLA